MQNAACLQDNIQNENNYLKEQLSQKDALLEQKNNRIKLLEEFIHQLKHRQFGASSEKLSPDQVTLFNEVDESIPAEEAVSANESELIEIAAHTRQAKKSARIPDTLPREEIIHDLNDEEKVCPHDGTALKLIGAETSEQLDIIPAQIKVLRHIRNKYACPCCEAYMVTAPKPKQPIEKSMAAPGLLAYVATQKYVDALPLHRQEKIFERIGVELDRTTLANWMMACGHLIQPLINLLHERMLEEKILHMDETPVQVLNEPGKTPQSKSYMWILKSTQHPAVMFHYAPTRSAEIPKTLLSDYHGALMVDGYEGYSAACQQNNLIRLGCWAHARRKFIEAKAAQGKNKTGRADQALAWIQKLYRIEQETKNKNADERQHYRQQHAQPIIEKLKVWLEKSRLHVPPQTALGKALHYLHTQYPRLIRYLENGNYPIDNNAAENAIRPFVIGRKNWLFSASTRRAVASAHLYSLIETAKANGLEPYAYLRQVFTDLPNAQSIDAIDALLPWNVKSVVR